MRGKHDYSPTCQCFRCKSVRGHLLRIPRQRHTRPEPKATREEQHGRYLDCGPGAWDDRD